MEKQNIKINIDNYSKELKTAIHHPILLRDIGEVQIDEIKAFFLLLPMLNGEKWTGSMNAAAIAVGAVHAAFDAHDAIQPSDAISTRQQLTVLSGDYFSGIHYRILASIPDLHFIRALSSMIGLINEMKTNFHTHSPSGQKELLETLRTIESGCITQFFHSYGFSKYVPLVSASLALLSLDSLKNHSNRQTIPDALGWEMHEKDAELVKTELKEKIGDEIDKANFITPSLKERILRMTTPLLRKMI